jgi:hypothetical protein
LLYTNSNSFAITALQTNNILLLVNEKLAEREEMKLYEAGFLVKEKEKLMKTNLIKFNRGYITIQGDDIILT